MAFQVLSPDGFPIERDKSYSNLAEVQKAIERFIKRFSQQGYYSSNRGRIELDCLENECNIKEI